MNIKKLDPLLLEYIPMVHTDPSAASKRSDRFFANRLASSGDQHLLPLLVHTQRDRPLAPLLDRLGAKIHHDRGATRTLRLPPLGIEALTDLDDILHVQPARRLFPHLNQAALLHQIAPYRQRFAPSRMGKGVLIGVVDTGIDGLHGAFTGRIIECWDQTVHGPGDAPYGYGALVTDPAQMRDDDGHGTHVAAIAVGNDPSYMGLAPASALIVVKTTYSDNDIHDAIAYIFERGRQLSMPTVINLSLGGHGDPHDGSDGLDRLISAETGPGRIVVASAGNEGESDIHMMRQLQMDEVASAEIALGEGQDRLDLHLWYEGSKDLEVRVRAPGGLATDYQGVRPDAPQVRYGFGPGVQVILRTPDAHPINGDRQVQIDASSRGAAMLPRGIWEVELRCLQGPITVHGWIKRPRSKGAARWTAPARSYLIGAPGAAPGAITVGAIVSRSEWICRQGIHRSAPMGQLRGDIASFSSPGPLRRASALPEIAKPDVAAAGAMICSARSSHECILPPEYVIDDTHAVMMGTSMASPAIAGLVATLLEAQPDWGPKEVRDALQAATGRGTHTIFDGHGLVRADLLP